MVEDSKIDHRQNLNTRRQTIKKQVLLLICHDAESIRQLNDKYMNSWEVIERFPQHQSGRRHACGQSMAQVGLSSVYASEQFTSRLKKTELISTMSLRAALLSQRLAPCLSAAAGPLGARVASVSSCRKRARVPVQQAAYSAAFSRTLYTSMPSWEQDKPTTAGDVDISLDLGNSDTSDDAWLDDLM